MRWGPFLGCMFVGLLVLGLALFSMYSLAAG
jgi:hypothetical protein